jgi:hypothetical protein
MYDEKYDKLDNSVKGKAAVSLTNPTVIYFNYPGYSSMLFLNSKNIRVGYLTGRWTTVNGINYFQVEFENDFSLENNTYHWGCVDAVEYNIVDMGSKSGAEALVNDLIANNKTIFENNLLCAGMVSKMKANNEGIPIDYQNKLYVLQSRLQARNEKITNSAFIDSKQTASPTGFDRYAPQLQEFMNTPGIGILPVVAYIVVSVVFGLLVSALIYLLFKPDYTDSKADLKVSADLTKALATLSPEARAAVISDLEGQVDKAYVTGKTDGSGASLLKTGMYLGLGFIGFQIIDRSSLLKPKS